MLNVANILDESALRSGQRTALVCGAESWDYVTLNANANRVANALEAAGVQAGDKVALSCPNVPWFVAIYYGILKTGAVVVPLNILLKDEEVAYHLEDSGCCCYFCHEDSPELPLFEHGRRGFERVDSCRLLVCISSGGGAKLDGGKNVKGLKEFVQDQSGEYQTRLRSELDVAVLLYTSGTTGQAKGAALSHSNILWNVRVTADLFEFKREDVMLTVLPLFHSFGQTCQMNTSVLVGSTNVLVTRFDPEAVMDTIAAHAVNLFAGVPTMYWALLNTKEDRKRLETVTKNMRMFISGGSAMPVEIIRRVKEVFSLPVYEGYGLSECAPVVTFNHPGREPLVGSVGTPIWGIEVRIVDKEGNPVKQGEAGELLCRGHSVMVGYHNKEEESKKALAGGWLHTGDIAKSDEQGYLYIVDRAKDLIVRGGFNVYPREVEETMLQHPAVSLVAVIGVSDEQYGEEIKAFVVREEGAELDEKELISWCKDKMAAYKYPRQVEFRDSLPTNATGKILKRTLK